MSDAPAVPVAQDPSGTLSDPDGFMRSVLQRIATGPELSRDLPAAEAQHAMRLILEGRAHPVQAGVFLIALRMKRETDDETRGILDAVREATRARTAEVDELVDLADPYDGFLRTLPASPFLPALLAACGVPAVSHGVECVGPKRGVSHRRVLRAAGAPVDCAVEEGAARVADGAVGWTYLDQSVFCPPLSALVELRERIVKRPVITTVEGLAGALRGRRATHLVTGYVHKPYPRIYTMLARHAGYASALVVRGTEGAVIPSLRQTGKCWFYRGGGEDASLEFQPAEAGIGQTLRAVPLPPHLQPDREARGHAAAVPDLEALAQAAAEAGLEALAGRPGPSRDALVYGAALCLWHLGRAESLAAGAAQARAALDAGRAQAHFEAGAETARPAPPL